MPVFLKFVGEIGIILNDFQSWFYSTIKIGVKLIWELNPKITEIKPSLRLHRMVDGLLSRPGPPGDGSIEKTSIA